MNPFADLEEWPKWVALWHQHDEKGCVVPETPETIEPRALEKAARSNAAWGPFGFDVNAVWATHKAIWEKLREQIASGKKVVYAFQQASGKVEPIAATMGARLTFDVLKGTANFEGLTLYGVEIRNRDQARIEGTGAPGRPSSMHLLLDEAKRRLAEGKLVGTQEEEAKSLLAWLATNHPEAPRPGLKTITNKLAVLRPKRTPVSR
jgi:hypothetical protein